MTRRCHEHANQECVVAYSRLSRAINRRAMAVTPRTSPTFDKISSKCRSNARRDRTPDHMQVLWSPAAKSDSKVLQEQPDADLTSSISASSTTAVSTMSPPSYVWSSSAPRDRCLRLQDLDGISLELPRSVLAHRRYPWNPSPQHTIARHPSQRSVLSSERHVLHSRNLAGDIVADTS